MEAVQTGSQTYTNSNKKRHPMSESTPENSNKQQTLKLDGDLGGITFLLLLEIHDALHWAITAKHTNSLDHFLV
jgi:hypothetical protein